MTKDLVRRCEEPVRRALSDAKLSTNDLHQVILIGGSTRMPAVQELVKRLTSKNPNLTVNPDEAVSIGAAIQVLLLLVMLKTLSYSTLRH